MAPAKTKDADFFVDDSAAALAESWLDQMQSSSGKNAAEDSDNDGGDGIPRPSRLGLGAKFLPHSKALKANDPAANRLENKLKGKKQKESQAFEEKRQKVKTGDEEESRTQAVKKPKVLPKQQETAAIVSALDGKGDAVGKKKKKKKGKGKSSAEEAEGQQNRISPSDASADSLNTTDKKKRKHADVEDEKEAETRDRPPKKAAAPKPAVGRHDNKLGKAQQDNSVTQGAADSTEGSPATNPDGEEKRDFNDPEGYVHKPRRRRVKGKKTRSKQKNMKKDNRPAHLKPGYQGPAKAE